MVLRSICLLIFIASFQSFCFSQTHDLNYYLAAGYRNSPLLREYSNQLALNKIDSLLILAGRKVLVTGSGEVLIAPIINGYGYDEAITNKGQYTAIVGVKKPIFQTRYVNAQLLQNRLLSDSIQLSRMISKREFEKTITEQYLNCYDTLLQIGFEKQIISLLQTQLVLLEPLVQSGIYLQTDALTLRLQIESEKITLESLEDDYRSNLYTLNALCGIFDTIIVDIARPELEWKTPGGSLNPNVQLFLRDSMSIEASRSLLHYNYSPKFNLFGDAGYQAIPDDPSFKKFGFSAGISVEWNLYDGGLKSLHEQQLEIRKTSFSSSKNYYLTQAALQMIDLEKRYQSATTIIAQWNTQANQMNELINLQKQQLQNGQLSVIDYLVSLRDYRAVQHNRSSAEMNQQRIIVEHNFLVW